MSKRIFVLGVIALIGVGVTFAANQALPGDTLYNIKLQVNEKVGDMFASSDSARAARTIMLIERRLEEASAVAAQGKVEGAVYASIVSDFNLRMQEISETISTFNNAGRTEEAKTLAVNIARVLSKQSQALMIAQAAAQTRGDSATGQSLDFILLNVTRALTAAAMIATGQTTLEGTLDTAAGTQLEGTPEVQDANLNP